MHATKHLRVNANALSFAFAFAAVLCTGNSLAQIVPLRLGNPEVLSSLGSPLWVKFPITIDPAEPVVAVDASRFSLGARPLNAPVPFVERAEITLEHVGDKYALLIRSRNAIDEPAVGIVLREALPNGVRSREFFLLLDPAPLSVAVAADQNRESTEREVAVPPLQATQTITPPRIAENQLPALAAPATKDTVVPQKKVRRARSARTDGAQPSAASRAQSSITPIAKGETLRKNRSASARATAPTQTEGGPRLRLSFGEDLTTRPPTTEAERADLRMRQFTLDMDDLTSGLLERQHKITQLEKELASLSLRVSAAERLIGTTAPVVTAIPSAAPIVATAAPPASPAEPAVATLAPAVVDTPAPAAKSATPKKNQNESTPSRPDSVWGWSMTAAALLGLLSAAIWGIRRARRNRDEAYRLTGQRPEDYVAEVLSQRPAANANVPATTASGVGGAYAVRASLAKPELADIQESSLAEIHFELPELPPSTQEPLTSVAATPRHTDEPAQPGVTNVVRKPADEATSRRMRYLQSRYQDIAILMPPLDAPQRLLRQAATVYDEGATDFAKRLLKFASYSRPYTEEFWLALLELLYREKFASDYVVNARWFHQNHAESAQWDEVMRIGFLLDPAEPLFTPAAHWSHEEPATGVWLPHNPEDKKPVSVLPHLKLEFVK